MNATTTSRRSDWLVPTLLIALSLVPAIAGTARLTQLATGVETTQNARFFAQPIPVVLHILTVIPYSMLGAFQFSRGFRRRHRAWHRKVGRVLGVCGLVVALTGLWMAHFYAWPAGDGVGVYIERLIAGTAMFASIVLGIDAVRRRDFVSHGAWMTRAYAIGMGAGTQVLTHLPWVILVGQPGELARTVLMGSAWVINVVVAEWIIRRGRSVAALPESGSLALADGPVAALPDVEAASSTSGPPRFYQTLIVRCQREEARRIRHKRNRPTRGRPTAHERCRISIVVQSKHVAKLVRHYIAHRVRQRQRGDVGTANRHDTFAAAAPAHAE
jgi:uncharacterized membrane protein